ncbi:MAG TPA: hypothetical protein VJT73_14905 [Polyangiaceae bacterium]|nr:hypothetical protein [Polyangiaceae bacterium]
MRKLVPVAALTATLISARSGRANCDPPSHLSTCIDVDTAWPHAGPRVFGTIGGTDTTRSGLIGFGLVTTYVVRPLVLSVPSPDPQGARVPAVDRLWDSTFLWSFGITDRFDASLALPVTVYRSGTGVSSLTQQATSGLSRTALRDARVGAAFALVPRSRTYPGDAFASVARFELAIPTGDETSYAGDRSFVVIPSVAADFREGIFFAAAELGARLRKTSDLLGTRVGSQLTFALGVGLNVLEKDELSFQLEAVTLPTLVTQDELAFVSSTGERVPRGTRPMLAPTEWQASVRSAPVFSGDAWVSFAGGGSLGLTGESSATAPSYRFTLSLAYAPLGRNAAGGSEAGAVPR